MSENQPFVLCVDVLLYDELGNTLLIERLKDPFKGKLAMPGGKKENNETLAQCGQRELLEETGILIEAKALNHLCILDALNRDPRPGRWVSYVFYHRVTNAALKLARPGSDAKSLRIVPITEATSDVLAFDHFKAYEALRKML